MTGAVTLPPAKSRPARRRGHEFAFLPAALEVVETPPSPIGRAISGLIIVVFLVAILWASLGRIDIIAVAQGKIIPSGSTKTLQPLESGIVRAIHVKDGQAVKAGDVLVELDSTVSVAERTRTEADLVAARLDAARLRALLSDVPDPVAQFEPPQEADRALVAAQRHLLASEVAERRAKAAAMDNQKIQKEKEVATLAASIAKIEAILPILRQRFEGIDLLLTPTTPCTAFGADADAPQDAGDNIISWMYATYPFNLTGQPA
ncbi:MAG: hypothetical protein B7Y77_01450, partial [Bradyrhizobium sp. 35-63-5]